MNPKEIIFDQIKNRFEGTGIEKMILHFDIHTEKYRVMLSNNLNEPIHLDLKTTEMTMIKLFFINKVKRKYEKDYNEKLKSLIIEIDIINEDFKIFTENQKGKVYEFDY